VATNTSSVVCSADIGGTRPTCGVVIVSVLSSALLNWSSSVGFRASKEDEILIWIGDYKGFGTPWLLRKCLMEGDSCRFITQKELFDLVRGGHRDGSGEQMFALANITSEDRFADQP
jgi:hypothetical protein